MFKLFVAFIAIALFLVLIAQNASYVDVSFFHYTWKVPLFLLLLVSFGFGFVLPYLYFFFRETALKSRLLKLKDALKELGRGYLGRSEKVLASLRNSFKESAVLSALVLDMQGRHEDVKSIEGSANALAGYILLKKGLIQEAKGKFQKAFEEDQENLMAIKGLRDISFLEGKIEEALELQKKVLKLTERWDKENQKAIKAELLAHLYLKKGEEELIQEAYDSHTTPYVIYAYIVSLLKRGKIKDAKKQFEKAFSFGFQEDLLWHMLEDPKSLAELYDYIEENKERISPDTLAMVYLRLNLFKKAEAIQEKLSPALRAIILSTTSHREEERRYGQVVEELLFPFVCSCGKPYKKYKPLCDNCYTWTNIRRRGS